LRERAIRGPTMLRDFSYFAMDAYCSPLHRAAAILNIHSFIIEWIAKRSIYLAGNHWR
jgi:hypothetical protein